MDLSKNPNVLDLLDELASDEVSDELASETASEISERDSITSGYDCSIISENYSGTLDSGTENDILSSHNSSLGEMSDLEPTFLEDRPITLNEGLDLELGLENPFPYHGANDPEMKQEHTMALFTILAFLGEKAKRIWNNHRVALYITLILVLGCLLTIEFVTYHTMIQGSSIAKGAPLLNQAGNAAKDETGKVTTDLSALSWWNIYFTIRWMLICFLFMLIIVYYRDKMNQWVSWSLMLAVLGAFLCGVLFIYDIY